MFIREKLCRRVSSNSSSAEADGISLGEASRFAFFWPLPVRLGFFDFVAIPDEQEKSIIKELEDNKVNWILISNRHSSTESGLGTFGESNCPLLAKYIHDHFAPVAEFGDWINPPGWAWNHGVRILKRVK